MGRGESETGGKRARLRAFATQSSDGGRPRWLPAPSLVLACLALLASMGGLAYAGGIVGDNTVRSEHIVDEKVKTIDLAANAANQTDIVGGAVYGNRVQNQTIQNADLATGGVEVSEIADKSIGQADFKSSAVTAGLAEVHRGASAKLKDGVRKTVASLQLGTGDYLVFYAVSMFNNDATAVGNDDASVICGLAVRRPDQAQKNLLDTGAEFDLGDFVAVNRNVRMQENSALEVQGTTNVSLYCANKPSSSSEDVRAFQPVLVAVRLQEVR